MTNHLLADISLLSLTNDLSFCPSFVEDTVRQFKGSDKNRAIEYYMYSASSVILTPLV